MLKKKLWIFFIEIVILLVLNLNLVLGHDASPPPIAIDNDESNKQSLDLNPDIILDIDETFQGTIDAGEKGGKFRYKGKLYELGADGFVDISEGKIQEIENGKEIPLDNKVKAQGNVDMHTEGNTQIVDNSNSIQTPTTDARNVQGFTRDSNGNEHADRGEHLTNGVTSLTDFENYDFTAVDNIVSAETSGSVTTPDTQTENANNWQGTADRFSIDQGTVNVHGFRLETNKPSAYNVYKNGFDMTTEAGAKTKITDENGNEYEWDADENNKLAISKDHPPIIKIRSGIFSSPIKGQTDIVQVKAEALIQMGTLGIKVITLTPGGTYRFENPNRKKDFSINIPMEGKNYKLALRKLPGETFTNPDGVVDFPKNNIQLLGIVNYLRIPFEEDIQSYIMEPVYEGKHEYNKAELQLDNSFININNFKLENPKPEQEYSIVRSGHYEIREQPGARLQKINNEFYPDLIKEYSTDTSEADIIINNKLLTQKGNTKVNILTKGTETVYNVGNFMKNYWNRLTKTLAEFLG